MFNNIEVMKVKMHELTQVNSMKEKEKVNYILI